MSKNHTESFLLFATRKAEPTEMSMGNNETIYVSTSSTPKEQVSSMEKSGLGMDKHNTTFSLSPIKTDVSQPEEKANNTNDSISSSISYSVITIKPSPQDGSIKSNNGEMSINSKLF